MLEGKKILLGVCGSIAAYKSATLVRLLVKAGANVQVVMTPDSTNFITPLTLSTLSKNPVYHEYFKAETGEWNNHVELGLWADIMVIAPASANTMAKMAGGLVDNLLTAVYLSAKCPVYFAPAMDLDMWKHNATRDNISQLQSFGNILIPPGSGELASGLHGEGRMAEPEEIVSFLADDIRKKLPLVNKRVMVTAGPTYEAIDPVRFIGNHSSGKMGFAIADELASLGASVTLVAGPTAQKSKYYTIKRIDVTSAAEMLEACLQHFNEADACVMCAAVADYTPAHVAEQKIKKTEEQFSIELKKTTDILKTLGQQKRSNQVLVGFALETNNEEQHAIEKLKKKNLDLIVLNSLNDSGAGFKSDTNKVTLIDSQLNKTHFGLKSKTEVAHDICAKLVELM
ncbi:MULTISPECIES: bifunctional phosphopantothenoylcysteine decarboxylase/phosphopantothenate--cysteine ligase CoaBC [unclassified Mucilaginibacter]|uniref:bifunctional phosphopantothenoylcysteine decarboxylase/phosphopantothenate--cysteine ligase CoaBC n=1 Tax=unclassified Mucilaginibacter TaxID=2617802 RepID=UPI000968C91B|nr:MULTISPECIES: bifunctional phosphopantothenoylcysteine decarboxylase/phosphopantothenate--cysteine ligase CoaBC [unclassified Mucilaginibacter]OJW12893.1 MAG: phosphopantothenoylcysteine decarboxylase [Mucilaginibacter sp. 44-25]PLW91575.1 MAG: bifunctional phosphopantothenoylcysteine decarboxylase/phosphopantothenate--cysteine ligase CoaBC [Mucilaginibacter sp.]HEK19130.1 bifunctional phosphopantothenoylcysteine decarboxylase/phosphopantothenate--cysteine ligase CoaBC [Bacteroidota bacterium